MTSGRRGGRPGAALVRLVAAGLGSLLAIAWVVGMSLGATSWLTWMMALTGLGCFGSVALVPEERSGFAAAANLAFLSMILGGCWIVALATRATSWLAWSSFVAALLLVLAALTTVTEAVFDRG